MQIVTGILVVLGFIGGSIASFKLEKKRKQEKIVSFK